MLKCKGWRTEIFSSLKIIPANSLPQFERGPSGLQFAYSLYAVFFLICFKMATDVLQNLQAKNLYFPSQLSRYHMTSSVTMLLIILRRLGASPCLQLAPKQVAFFSWILLKANFVRLIGNFVLFDGGRKFSQLSKLF